MPLLCSSEDKFARDPFNENASEWMLREFTNSDRFGEFERQRWSLLMTS